MFCQKCGTENKDDASFCGKCGNNLSSIKIEKKTGNGGKETFSEPIDILNNIITWVIIVLIVVIIGTWMSSSDSSNIRTSQVSQSISKLGDRIVVGDFAYTFNDMTTSKQIGESLYGTFVGKKADGKYIILDVTIENVAKESKTIPIGSIIKIVDDQGRKFEHDSSAEIYLKDEAFSFTQLQPGLPKRGKIVFDVPENINGKIEIAKGLWSSEMKYVSLTIEPTSSTQVKTAGTATQVQEGSISSVTPTTTYTLEPVVVATPTGIITPLKIMDFKFRILNVQINAGDEVLWNNFDEDYYTIVELDNKIANITLKGTGKASYIFNRSGSYKFGLYYINKGSSYLCTTLSQCMSNRSH